MTNSAAEHLLSVKAQIESAVEGGGVEMREGAHLLGTRTHVACTHCYTKPWSCYGFIPGVFAYSLQSCKMRFLHLSL